MSTFRVVMLTTAIPEEDISEYRVYVNDELEHTFNPTGVPQTENFTVTGGTRGDLMRLAAVRSSDGQEFEEQAATFTAYRPNITRFEQIGDAPENGDVTVEADVTLTEGAIDRVEVVYDNATYQLTETATAGTWSGEMPVAEGTNDAVCTAFEDSVQGLGSAEETIAITSIGEPDWTLQHNFDMAGASLPLQDTIGSATLAADGVGTGNPTLEFVRSGGTFDGVTGVEITIESQGLQVSSLDAATFSEGIMLQIDAANLENSAGNAQVWTGGMGDGFREIKRQAGTFNGMLILGYRDEPGGANQNVNLEEVPPGGSRIRIIFLPNGEVRTQRWSFGDEEWSSEVLRTTVGNPGDFYANVLSDIDRGPRLDGGSGDPTDWLQVFDYKIFSKNA